MFNLNNIDEMIGHLKTLKTEQGTDRAVSAGRAIGFFLDEMKTEIAKSDNRLFDDVPQSLINLTK